MDRIPEFLNLPKSKDYRGIFTKFFHRTHPQLMDYEIKQVNHVRNSEAGIFRGLHYQSGIYQERKLFRVLTGAIQFVCFCYEERNVNYRKSYSFDLYSTDQLLLVPSGYATGYLVLKADTEVLYMSDQNYEPLSEKGIRWNDPNVRVHWQIAVKEVSEKDNNWNDFEDN